MSDDIFGDDPDESDADADDGSVNEGDGGDGGDGSGGSGGDGDGSDDREVPRADPFDELAEHGDREGDPFERLGGPDGESDADSADATDDADATSGADTSDEGDGGGYTEPDPFEYMGDEQRGQSTAAEPGHGPEPGPGPEPEQGFDPGHEPGPAEPLSDVEVSDADPFEAPGGVFEQVDVGAADPDEVWDRLTGEPEPEPPEEAEDDVVDVSKHSFCEGCPHFSAPPDVHCTHEGTEILEFTDVETVRVVNCPVVVERRELGGFEE